MDQQTHHDMETMAEWASTMDAYDRLQDRRSRRHQSIRFWFNIHQVAADPARAVPAPRVQRSPVSPLGAGTGPAGSESAPPPPMSPTLSTSVDVDSPAGPHT